MIVLDHMTYPPLLYAVSVLLAGKHLAQPREADAQEQDQAGRDLLIECGHLQQRHAVGDGAEN